MDIKQYMLPIDGTDSTGKRRIYQVYNTLDYPIRLGFTKGSEGVDIIYWEPILSYDESKEENDIGSVLLIKDRMKDLQNMAQALKDLQPVQILLRQSIRFDKESVLYGLNTVDDSPKLAGMIYPKYSAKDRFLVPMETYIYYTNSVDQNIQVHESLICTHTAIPNYARPQFIVREHTKTHRAYPPLDLPRLNSAGAFIFGQHEK